MCTFKFFWEGRVLYYIISTYYTFNPIFDLPIDIKYPINKLTKQILTILSLLFYYLIYNLL